MKDVFLSYSRRDGAFVERLVGSIEERGKEVWVDTAGIEDAEVFPRAIRRAIEESNAFLFVITPASVESAYCEQEIAYARELDKRIVPVLRVAVPDSELPAEIRDRNWIAFTDESTYDQAIERVVKALDRDLEHVREHTRWLVKALEWQHEGRDRSFLLRGSELRVAEAWLAGAPEDADPPPTQLQRQYLLSSRQSAARRQRVLLASSLAVTVLSVGLLVFALISRQQAISERTTETAQALAATSQADVARDPQLAMLLAIRAVRTRPTDEAILALRQALDQSSLVLALRSQGPQATAGCARPGIAYQPGRSVLAEALCSGRLLLFDSGNGRLSRTLHVAPPGEGPGAIAFSSNGGELAIPTPRGVQLRDTRTLKPLGLLTLPPGAPPSPPAGAGGAPASDQAVAFSPDGTELAAALGQHDLVLWDLRTRQGRILSGAQTGFGNLVFAHGGGLLVAAGTSGAAYVFDTRSGHLVRSLSLRGGGSGTTAVAISPNTRRLAIGGMSASGQAGVVDLWDTADWRSLGRAITIPRVQVTALGFTPDGTRLAVGAADGSGGVWSVQTHEQLAAFNGQAAQIAQVAVNEDDRVATIATDGSARIWRTQGSESTYVETGSRQLDGIALTASKIYAATTSGADTVVRSWSLATGRMSSRARLPHSGDGLVDLSPNGQELATIRRQGVEPIELWSLAQRRVIRRLGPTGAFDLTFSPDGTHLAVVEGQPVPGTRGRFQGPGPVVVFDVRDGRPTRMQGAPPPCPPYRTVAFSGDGARLAAATFCGQIAIWNVRSGRLLRTVNEGSQVSDVALDRHGRTLAVSAWDSHATLWNVMTGRVRRQLIGHTRGVDSITLTPDGSDVLTTSLDGTARLWQAATGRVLRVLTPIDNDGQPQFSPSGQELAIADNNGALRVWPTCPACTDPRALLGLASRRAVHYPTASERAALALAP